METLPVPARLGAVQVEVNGEAKQVEEGASVADLLAVLGLFGRPVAVERNQSIIPRALQSSTQLSEGDRLEVVQFVGGG